MWLTFLRIFEDHFSVMILTVMFFGGSILLAHYGLYEEMSRWIEGGPTVVALVAILKNVNNNGGKNNVDISGNVGVVNNQEPEKKD